ncbi:HepT-like ribonuclease domain-containing protein [Cyclobacterium sp.]|uniref:HepT-like ribonuclease domain-containing protein n=1 Tax=Cyclobacterium sp. TaxID=1966343 RepID=UPI00199A7967|nr:HepT-like ribonuclease domain-containing protein [Cyclobacterium sp.]MBD3631331.1 DUF86 domain-containing protein [Cyclobacterium sp.]
MENEIRTWLSDIKQAIEEINIFLSDKRDFFEFRNDLKTRRAIERNVEIIGEAVNRILKVNPDIEIQNSRKIVDTRNRIIHGYDRVSEEIIWSIVIRDLPKLEIEVKDLLEDADYH